MLKAKRLPQHFTGNTHTYTHILSFSLSLISLCLPLPLSLPLTTHLSFTHYTPLFHSLHTSLSLSLPLSHSTHSTSLSTFLYLSLSLTTHLSFTHYTLSFTHKTHTTHSGTGDLVAALILSFTHKHPDDVVTAITSAFAATQVS